MKAFQRLRIRLTVVCAASTGLVLVAMAVYSYLFAANQLREQAEKSFEGELNSIFYTLGTQEVIDHTWLYRTERDGRLVIGLENTTSHSQYNSQTPLRQELTSAAREAAMQRYGFDPYARPSSALEPDTVRFILQTEHGNFRAAVSRLDAGDQWLNVAVLKDMSPEQLQVSRLRWAFLGGVVVAVILLGAFAWFFTVWAARPIEENRKRQANFISAVSHELRSPLAVASMNAEVLDDAVPSELHRFTSKITKECGRMSRLIEDMLRLARADGQSWAMTFAPAHAESIIISVMEHFEQPAAEKQITLSDSIPSEPLGKVNCDKGRIEQVLTILVDNALRYTPEGGAIRLAVSKTRRHMVFTVADSGVGIPDDKKNRIFDRFYRGDESRTDKEHYGLGLSIAMEIVLLHNGDMAVGDSPLGGAEFTVKLPL